MAAGFSATPISFADPPSALNTITSPDDTTGWGWFFSDKAQAGARTQVKKTSADTGGFPYSIAVMPDGGIVLRGGKVIVPGVLISASRSTESIMDLRFDPGTSITQDSRKNLQTAIDDTRHSFNRDRSTGAWYCYNPAQGTSLVTTGEGVILTTPAGNAGFTLNGIGRSGAMSPAGAGAISADGRVLRILRDGYTEWYRNSDNSITQGMDIAQRPGGDGNLLVTFDLAGNLSPSMVNQILTFSDENGPVLEYQNLRAWDSTGRVLTAAMALDGTILTWEIDDSSAVYPITIDPDFVLKQSEYSPGPAGDSFGRSVSVSGNYAIVGAIYNDTGRAGYGDTGAVYFYKTSDSGNTWVLKQVDYSPGSPVEYFGTSVSVSGDYAVVGADYNDTLRGGYDNAGAAYFYKTTDTGNTWVLKQVEYSPGISGDRFGYEVRVSGNYAIIGAPYNDTLKAGYADAGATYFYKTSDAGNSWVLKQVDYSPGRPADYFGFSVFTSGDYAVVGAPFNDTLRAGYGNAGAAYFYTTPDTGNSWVLRQAEYNPGIAGDYFGRSVSVAGNYAVIGAYYNDTLRAGYADAGAVYFYKTTDAGNTWISKQAEYGPGSGSEWFGSSVAVAGDYAVVGAAHNDTVQAGYADAGAAYFYSTSDTGNTWVLKRAEYSPGTAGDSYGWSVSVAGDYAIVGAVYNDTVRAGYADAGAVYYYLLVATPPVAGFTANVTSGTAPLAVLFTDSSTKTPTSWNWSFGDGTYGTTQNPVHTYSTAGTYTVALNATNADGSNTLTRAGYITVSQPAPVAAFSGSPTSGSAPLSVTFTDSSTGSPTGWAWFFGDEPFTNPWTQQNSSAGWAARNWPSSGVMPDGSIVLTGGNAAGYKNDTWRSTDNGATWAQVNASSGWGARFFHSSVVMPDGSIVLMGGYGDPIGVNKNDTWRSTDNGATWTLMNASSGWLRRNRHSSVVMPDGSIVLMGGEGSSNSLNDTWRSTDNGATWTQVNPSSGWVARYAHSSVVMPDGSIVLMGGWDGTNGWNDTWRSTDYGATWARVTASAGWTARDSHSSVVLPEGSIVLMGGYDIVSEKNDVWRSPDNGATWARVNVSAGWSARNDQSSVALPDGSIVLMGGYDSGGRKNDVWRFNPVGSSFQNPSHTFNAAGTYSVALQAHNAAGYNSTRKTGYVSVTAAGVSSPQVYSSSGDSSSSDSSPSGAPGAAPAPVVQQQQPQLQQQPALAPQQEEAAAAQPGEVTESYPMGFEGLSFNADNQNTLSLDLAAASDAGAEVTQFFDRIEIYQHSSPGVRIAFFGNNFTFREGKLFGKVDRAEFRTDPLTGNITEGNVTGSVRADLIALTTQVAIDETLRPNTTAGARLAFRSAAAAEDLDIGGTAFTLDVTKATSLQTGSANITMTVPAPWVEQNGGRDMIRIARVPANASASELLSTRYAGIDQAGALVFEAYSPRGTSLFGLLAVKAQETKATPAPTGGEPAPVPKTAVTTVTGMVSWIVILLENNLIVGIPVVVIGALVVLYFWRQKRQY